MASDVYSFGIVAIYVVLKKMVFWPGEEAATCTSTDGEAWRSILYNHISYFGDWPGFRGLLMHLGEENEYVERLLALLPEVKPKKPFSLWEPVDPEFRDLILKMTSLDPAKRITAREAPKKPWFREG